MTEDNDKLCDACSIGDIPNILSILKEEKASDFNTALFNACENGHTPVVNLLMAKKKDYINLWHLQWGLFMASRNGHLDTVKYLVKILSKNNEDDLDSALFFALKDGHKDIVEYLRQKGAKN